jgi:hypothetical protein
MIVRVSFVMRVGPIFVGISLASDVSSIFAQFLYIFGTCALCTFDVE